MAGELSQEAVLDFLCRAGGKVANAALLGHFRLFLRDPRAPAQQLLRRRETFKRYVNSVAVVKPEGAVKYVVLRSRYRDLLGEDWAQTAAPGSREDDQVLSPGAQVRDGDSNGASDQPAAASRCHQPSQRSSPAPSYYVTSSPGSSTSSPRKNASSLHSGPSMDYSNSSPPGTRTSPSDMSYHHQPINTYLSTNRTSLPASNTFSPQNNVSSSMEYKNSSPLVIRASPPTDKSYNQPITTYLSSSRTSSTASNTSSPRNNVSSLQRSSSMEYRNSSLPVLRTSPPSDKSYHHQPITTHLSSSRISLPVSNTSSPQNNVFSLHRSPSMDYSNSIPPVMRASPPSNKSYHPQPITTYLSSSRTSSSASNTSSPQNNASSLHRGPFMDYSNSSPPVKRTSPSDKSYHQQSITTYLTTLSASKDSSPSNKSNSSINNLNYNQSLLSSSVGSTDIPEIPSQVPGGHFKVLPVGQKKTDFANPAFVNATSRDQEGQKHGCFACTELQSSNFNINSFPPEEHKGYSGHLEDAQQMSTFYNKLPPYPPSTRYIDSPQTFPSAIFPHELSIALPDALLEDYPPASRSPTPPLPLYDIHEMWMSKMPVFKSIRCQLSLQDMEDFVDQESYGSEGSDSGEGADCDTEHNIDEDPSSDSNNDKYVHYIDQKCENTRRCPPSRKFLSINEQYDKIKSAAPMTVIDTLAECGVESARPALTTSQYSNSPYNTKSFLTDQAPVLFVLAKNSPRHKMSSHIQEVMSSSDEELIERDFKKRRRPSRARRPSNPVLVPPQPDVDLLLTVKPVSSNHFVTYDTKDQKSLYAQYDPKVNTEFALKKTFTYKSSSVVPLDSMEHDWSVKLASGSWLQVYGLFIEDPGLALRKDFISGFTAFHWFAKHGATDMFHKFVTGAKKAGIQLDANVKSNGGYTPLHIAAIHGHHKLAAMLVEKLNVNVKVRDNSGKRAWQYLSCNTSGEVWQLLGAPKGKTIFASRALNIMNSVSTQNKSSQISRKSSLAAFLKPQHQRWKANNHHALREREIYSD